MSTTIYFDGLCEPVNPGGVAAYGWLIQDNSGETLASGKGIAANGPKATNNVAEYAAARAALEAAIEMDLSGPILVRGDSQLVIKQVTGEWGCKARHLIGPRNRLRNLANQLGDVTFEWVPREENEPADRLSREAYREEGRPKIWGDKRKKKLLDSRRGRFMATFDRRETRLNRWARREETKILLTGICDADTGEVVSDRQYFSLSKVFEALGELAPGTRLSFDARLNVYQKGGPDLIRVTKIKVEKA
jgi:ribonuclease HI